MGSYRKGILGPFRGKVGHVIGYSWRGKDLMRGLPKEITTAATDKQLEQRAKFSTVVKFLTPIQEVISIYFGKGRKAKSPFNLAMGYHLNEALLPGPNGTWLIYFPKVLISRGPLRSAENAQVVAGAVNELNLTWLDNSGQGSAAATDQLIVVVYCTDMDEFLIFEPSVERSDAAAVLSIPPKLMGSLAEVWITFVTADQKMVAMSSYAGSATVP